MNSFFHWFILNRAAIFDAVLYACLAVAVTLFVLRLFRVVYIRLMVRNLPMRRFYMRYSLFDEPLSAFMPFLRRWKI